ncbi:MAG: hypothetical protein U0M02_13560 [Acutalibacteraceae bacterium]|nr:hypothetical protein [Acutalibacteraceae bacterium]
MSFKKIIVLFLAFAVIFLLSACKNDENTKESATTASAEVITTVAEKTVQDEITSPADETQISLPETTAVSDDPSMWNTEYIVDFYKNAAKKSHSGTKSAHGIELKKISVNNGQYEGLFEFITPIMSKLLANNSEDKDGITGGYNNLTASDVASAKAYISGDNTVVEMIMKNQVSGPHDDALSGSVGHAITAVGDIGQVVTQLSDLGLPLELSEKDTKIYFSNPTVRVVIDGNGKIINGTWKYTVEIRMDNFRAFGKTVETASVIMDNILTVGGGFKK